MNPVEQQAALRADLGDPNVVDFYDRFSGIPWETPVHRVDRTYDRIRLLQRIVTNRQVRDQLRAEVQELYENSQYELGARVSMRLNVRRAVLAELWDMAKEGRE